MHSSKRSGGRAAAAPPRQTTISFFQNLTNGTGDKLNAPIPILVAKEDTLKRSDFAPFAHARPIGISIGYKEGGSGRVLAIALVDDSNGMVFEFTTKTKKGDGRQLLQELVLCRESGPLVAFDMGPLVLSLFSEFELLVCQAIDLQSAFPSDDKKRTEIAAILKASSSPRNTTLKRSIPNWI